MPLQAVGHCNTLYLQVVRRCRACSYGVDFDLGYLKGDTHKKIEDKQSATGSVGKYLEAG